MLLWQVECGLSFLPKKEGDLNGFLVVTMMKKQEVGIWRDQLAGEWVGTGRRGEQKGGRDKEGETGMGGCLGGFWESLSLTSLYILSSLCQ